MSRFFFMLTILMSTSKCVFAMNISDNDEKLGNDSTMTFDELWQERDSLNLIIEKEKGSKKVLEQLNQLRSVDNMIIAELVKVNKELSVSDSILYSFEFLLSDSVWVFEKDKFLTLSDDEIPQILIEKYHLYTQVYKINQKLITIEGKMESLREQNPDLAGDVDLTKRLFEKHCRKDLEEIMNLLIVLKNSDLTPLSLEQKEFITYLDGEFYKLASLVE